MYLVNSRNDEVLKAVSDEQKYDVDLAEMKFSVGLGRREKEYSADLSPDKTQKIVQITLFRNPEQTFKVIKKQINQHIPEIDRKLHEKIEDVYERNSYHKDRTFHFGLKSSTDYVMKDEEVSFKNNSSKRTFKKEESPSFEKEIWGRSPGYLHRLGMISIKPVSNTRAPVSNDQE